MYLFSLRNKMFLDNIKNVCCCKKNKVNSESEVISSDVGHYTQGK